MVKKVILRKFDDGSTLAPSGTAQYPSLLNGYSKRPPWRVAGIDYAVGYPTGQTFKDPSVDALPTGATYASNLVRTNSTDNLTFDGWDFSLHNGIGLFVDGTTAGTIVKNCKFTIGSNSKAPIQSAAGSGNLTISYCVFDGAGIAQALGTLISAGGAGNLTLTYCWLKNATDDAVNIANSNHNHVLKYNLFDSYMFQSGAHADFLQTIGAINSLIASFNTFYQPVATVSGFPGGGNSFLRVGDEGAGVSVLGVNWGNNTAVSLGATGHNINGDTSNPGVQYAFEMVTDSGVGFVTGAQVHDNYLDLTGMTGFVYPIAASSGAGQNCAGVTGYTFANNWNMSTGAALTTTP